MEGLLLIIFAFALFDDDLPMSERSTTDIAEQDKSEIFDDLFGTKSTHESRNRWMKKHYPNGVEQ